ncbi:MAG: hypothetical protein ACRD5L_05545, partial [Bryobacteraceae bacterium]
MLIRTLVTILAAAATLPAQQATPAPKTPAAEKTYLIETGTRIPLSMVNSISTKSTSVGDRVYLETSFPIAVSGKIVIPAGSYVMGTITDT